MILTEDKRLTLRDVAQAALDLDAENQGTVTWRELVDRAKLWAARRANSEHTNAKSQPLRREAVNG